MSPTVGRIVVYTSLGSADGKFQPEPHPAIVTRVVNPHLVDNRVALCVFYTTGLFFMDDVGMGLPGERGTWAWPQREAR